MAYLGAGLGRWPPLVLVLCPRATGLTTRPVYTTAGVVGLIFLLMDAGGLTIRRFILWPVWAPTAALFAVHRILTEPGPRGSRERQKETALQDLQG